MSNDHIGTIFKRPTNPSSHPFLANTHDHPLGAQWRAALGEIKGESGALKNVLTTVFKVARSDSPVLVYGESGTGKELIAKALHRLSSRASRRFIAINCSAIPESLLESELFGYAKGAFTGADSRRKGLFEEAAGGTIFLDEIGDMALRLQAKLLRVIQEKQFTPVGSNEVKQTDVRIVAATNVDLKVAVEQKTFRLDLFYRLNVLPINLPALRDRPEDIPILLEHFLKLSNSSQNISSPCYFEPSLVGWLSSYRWPGNVRELQNLVERLVVMTGGGVIRYQDLPEELKKQNDHPMSFRQKDEASYTSGFQEFTASLHEASESAAVIEKKTVADNYSSGFDSMTAEMRSQHIWNLPEEGIQLTSFIEQLENSLIMQALEKTGFNKNRAAKLLGLNRTTLVERIKKRQLVPLNAPSKEL